LPRGQRHAPVSRVAIVTNLVPKKNISASVREKLRNIARHELR
jgi:hypothetical protein